MLEGTLPKTLLFIGLASIQAVGTLSAGLAANTLLYSICLKARGAEAVRYGTNSQPKDDRISKPIHPGGLSRLSLP